MGIIRNFAEKNRRALQTGYSCPSNMRCDLR